MSDISSRELALGVEMARLEFEVCEAAISWYGDDEIAGPLVEAVEALIAVRKRVEEEVLQKDSG